MDFRKFPLAALCLAALLVMPQLAVSGPDDSSAPDAPPGQVKPKPEEEQPAPTPEEETPPATEEPAPTESEPEPETGTDTELPPAAPPALGETVAVKAESGTIMIRLPGSTELVPLDAASGIPTGSLIDATQGEVRLQTATTAGGTQWAVFGGARFRVNQGAKTLATINLAGRRIAPCAASSSLASAAARTRSLWGRGKGRFRTRGRHGAATVRGTKWLTKERCDGTLVRVAHGSVWVKDFARKRRVLVRAGDRYLARAPR
jgi:hypothetical protein